MAKKSMRVIGEYTMITAATFVVAAAVYFFLIPSGVSVGSISGLAMLLGNVIPLPISVLTFILNAALLVVGFLFIGREFGVKTVYTSLILPVFLWVFEQVFPDFVSINQDAMMDTVCYIFVVSVGLALLFWMNASSGGLDIVAKLLNKYFHMELGKAMALPGMCVALSSVFFSDKKLVVLGILVCAKGLQNGLERVTKVMMIALLAIMVVLAVNSLFMPGAKEGLKFYLVPDFARMQEVGVVNTLVSAMNQAFFTLSLGIGAMAIFGSYIGKEHSLLGESVRIVVLDTFVAITAGLIIFPACFTYGVDQTSGPSLIFITLPNIFANMALGRLWGTLFFLFMAFAALSTVLAVFENIICCGMELTGCSRKKSSLVNLVLIIALSMPCVLGYNLWAWDGFAVFGGAVLDFEDFLVSNLFLPLGSLVYLLFCVTKYGWGWDNYKKEVNIGKGLKMHDWMRGYLTYVLPVIVLFIFAFGIYDKFFA